MNRHPTQKQTHAQIQTQTLPFVPFYANPNPALPAAEKKEKRRENLLPALSSNSLFNFKVLYWQGFA